MDRSGYKTDVYTDNARCELPIHRNIQWTRTLKSHRDPENHHYPKRHRHNQYLSAIGISLAITGFMPSVRAETVGGVSATASPIANSSGSVTNQAIQVLQGPYITNTYGNGIQCQGSTLNITPYVTGSISGQKPYEAYWNDPVYDVHDADDDGQIDNPGNILYYMPTRTGQKDQLNASVGVSATWSIPLDKKAQEQCKLAVETQIALQTQNIANKRLDFEIARLKNCGELARDGIRFHKNSPYHKICADVVVDGVHVVKPHVHQLNSSSSSEVKKDQDLSISYNDSSGSQNDLTASVPSSKSWFGKWSIPFLSRDEKPSTTGLQEVSLGVQIP